MILCMKFKQFITSAIFSLQHDTVVGFSSRLFTRGMTKAKPYRDPWAAAQMLSSWAVWTRHFLRQHGKLMLQDGPFEVADCKV